MKKPAKKIQKKIISTDYLSKIYNVESYMSLMPKAIKEIKAFQKKHAFDAIAFTGTSGSALAYPLSCALGIPLICVRKNDGNHFKRSVEGYVNAKRYLIVDDFISTGDTVMKIVKTISEHNGKSKPVGIFLYANNREIKYFNQVPVFSLDYNA